MSNKPFAALGLLLNIPVSAKKLLKSDVIFSFSPLSKNESAKRNSRSEILMMRILASCLKH